jgi:nucleotide-binding universal stress UspA family protein
MTAIQPVRRTGRSATTKIQPYRILVGSDGTDASLGAIRVAQLLARRKSASVHALSVATPFPHSSVLTLVPPALIDDENRHTALETLRQQLTTVRGTRGWTMRATAGFPADSIMGAAERWPADLIVVGLGRHGFIDRLIGSETAVKIAMHSNVAVLAVPPDAQQLPMHAVAAIDFTDASVAAAMLAATLLGPNGLLTLTHAAFLVKDESDPGSLVDVYTTGAREKLEAIRERIHRRMKRRVDVALRPGAVVDALTEIALARKADMIALGGHERPLLERLFTGSVRASILRNTGCAVLVARP